MNFQTCSTSRPKSAGSNVTEIDTIKKNPTDHLQIFTEGIKLMPEKAPMSKNDRALWRRFGVIQVLDWGGGGGGVFRHLPSHWRVNLVWLFRPRRACCVVAMQAAPTWPWRWLVRLGYFRCQYQRRVFYYISVNVGICKSTLVGRHWYHYMHCVLPSGWKPCPLK